MCDNPSCKCQWSVNQWIKAHDESQAEIARLKAELDAVKEARDMMGRLWQSARNDALEEVTNALPDCGQCGSHATVRAMKEGQK